MRDLYLRRVLFLGIPAMAVACFALGSLAEMRFGTTRRLVTLIRQDPLAGVNKGIESEFVKCPTDSLVVGFAGQSNNANSVPRTNLKRLNNAYMYDYLSNSCTVYSEPVIGTDGQGRGHVATNTVENLRQLGFKKPIIIVGFARGGSPLLDWSDGPYSQRTKLVAKSLKNNGMTMDFLLWHQGESDAKPYIGFVNKQYFYGRKDLPTQRLEWYERLLTKYLTQVRGEFPNIAVGVAIASYCNGDDSLAVRQAQRRVALKLDYADTTINTDNLKGTQYRYDDCHFNAAGAEVIGKNYAEFISTHLKQTQH